MLLVKYTPVTVVVSLSLLLSGAVFAETLISPASVNKNQQNTREYYELLKEQRKAADRSADEPVIEGQPAPVVTKTAAGAGTILIKRFEISASQVLSPDELAGVTDQYLNRKLNINQLMGVVQQINDLYATKAQIIARAVLPKQKVSGGVVKIQLIEATLGQVNIMGNAHTRASYVQDRVAAVSGELIFLDELEDSLFKFNRWNDVTLKASLVPGEEYGTTDIVVLANEPQQFSLDVFADNAGRKTVGRNRLGVNAQISSVLGFRDKLTLGTTVAEGALNAWGSYVIPVNKYGTKVGVFYDAGDIEIISGPIQPLNVTGDSSNLGVTITQPIITKRSYDWDASLGYVKKTSSSYFDDVELVSSKSEDVVLGTNLRFFDKSGTWLTSHSITYGESEVVKDKDYAIYNGSLIRLQYFENGNNLIFRSSWQQSNTTDLPSSEQFTVGGVASVRGYTEGLLSGDAGYALSAEYAYPIHSIDGLGKHSKFFVFADHGAAFPYRGDDGSKSKHEDFLASIGFGLDLDLFESVALKLSVGVPLMNRSFYDQDPYRINATLNWSAW